MANKKPSHSYNIHQADIKAAQELFYPPEVIEALRREEDPNKRTRILRNARISSME